MPCEQSHWLSDGEYWSRFAKKIDQLRIPFSGGIDLTRQCNLNCLHCYARVGGKNQMRSGPELNADQWKKILDEITATGCLHLLITGGEPLLRKDFSAIYTHAKKNGLLVTVFSNGTLVTEKTVELFAGLPPKAVEITLYGASAETYEAITGSKGAYERCLQGIEKLLSRQIRVKLKSVLLTLNLHEYAAMEALAGQYGTDFRLDTAVFPGFNGDQTPLKLRVTPEQAVEKELADPKKIEAWRDFLHRFQGVLFTDDLYQCGAGVSTFHIDPYGGLQPCLMVSNPRYDLLRGSFRTGWFEVMPTIRGKKIGAAYACKQCQERLLCGYCPGFFELENGAEDVRSEYLCATGKLRFEKISHHPLGGYHEANTGGS
jgi:radical SAM protein with 4Fe4S-binding SPASM domain